LKLDIRQLMLPLFLTLAFFSFGYCGAYCEDATQSNKAGKLFLEGKYGEALPLFKELVAADPRNERARYYLGMAYWKLNQLVPAKEQFQFIVDQNKDSEESRYSARMLVVLSRQAPVANAKQPATTRSSDSNNESIARDLEAAKAQADQILGEAETRAAALDLQASRLGQDMSSQVGLLFRGRNGRVYSQAEIDDATGDLRKQAKDIRDRANREAAEILNRAKMRAESEANMAQTTRTAQRPQQAEATIGSVPRIDELSYWHQIGPVVSESERHEALMLKPKYRQVLLSGQKKLGAILTDYSDTERETDDRWIKAHQAALQSFHPQPDQLISVAGYNPNQFVGYRIGKQQRIPDQDGICYKVFFEFQDPIRDLSPELYLQFSRELAKAGFIGDSKIGMRPGYARFFYNNVIVHATDPDDAKKAERVGFSVFGSRLAHYARGVDVMQTSVNRFPSQDWHEFLSTSSDLSRLPDKAVSFVRD
jgi:tetratricopeptide (TPR) repeat protein